MAVDGPLEAELGLELPRHPQRLDADAEEPDHREPRRPPLHLRRAGAAPASSAVVEVDDGGLAPKQLGRRGQLGIDGLAPEDVGVEVSHRFGRRHAGLGGHKNVDDAGDGGAPSAGALEKFGDGK